MPMRSPVGVSKSITRVAMDDLVLCFRGRARRFRRRGAAAAKLDDSGDTGGAHSALPKTPNRAYLDDGMPALPAQIPVYDRTRAANHAMGTRARARSGAAASLAEDPQAMRGR